MFQDGLTVNFGSVGWYSTIYLNSAPESRRITNGATSKWAVPPMGFALLIFYDIQRIARGRILVIFTLDRNGAKFILELSEYNLSRAVFQQSDLITVGIIIRARPKKP